MKVYSRADDVQLKTERMLILYDNKLPERDKLVITTSEMGSRTFLKQHKDSLITVFGKKIYRIKTYHCLESRFFSSLSSFSFFFSR